MLGFNRNGKNTCENYWTQTTEKNKAGHKRRRSAGSLTRLSCINYSTNSQLETIRHLNKKHSKTTDGVVHKCKICDKNFNGFYNVREHKRKEHGAHRNSSSQNADVTQLTGDVDENSPKQELKTWKVFLVDSEIEKGTKGVYNFTIYTLD